MRKRNRKRKRERILQLTGPGGISAHSARALGRACGPVDLAARKRGRGRRRSAGPPARERGGLTALLGNGGGRGSTGAGRRELRGGSPPSVRFLGGEVVAKHGRVKWVTGVGRILPAGAYGSLSAARWRVPAAVMPPVRSPATIGGKVAPCDRESVAELRS
jgi:hypothetical protein